MWQIASSLQTIFRHAHETCSAKQDWHSRQHHAWHAVQITVNGKGLPRATQPFYFAVNKPKGFLCANVPNKEGTTKLVIDLFEVSLMLLLLVGCV